MRYFFLPSTFLKLTLNRTDRFFPAAQAEETTGLRLAFLGRLTPSLRAGVGFHAERATNADGIAGNTDKGFATWLDLSRRFSGGYAYLSGSLQR